MYSANRLESCRECHSGKKDVKLATAGFISFSQHGTADDFDAYPQIWNADKIMVGLLVGTFAFLWIHTLLWFFRDYNERQQRKGQRPEESRVGQECAGTCSSRGASYH